jgi:hypothetical protein
MANKTKGYKDARAIEGMNSVTFYPEAPVFGKSDIDEVPEEHRQRCVLVSWPISGPERVFTESEVKGIAEHVLFQLSGEAESKARAAFVRKGIVLDPA